jgi:transposase
VEIITGEPRRQRTLEQKLAIVEATFHPGATVNGVARQVGANPSMVFSWRKQYRAQLGFPETPAAKGFAPVMLAAPEAGAGPPPGVIEVEFADGARLRVIGAVAPDLAAAVAKVLAKR